MRKFDSSLVNDQYRVPPPKSLREVPAYIKELASGFSYRMLYIFRLVWETRRGLLPLMLLMAVFNGVMPVIGSLIGAAILNDLARVYAGEALVFGVIAVLLVLQFVYMFVNNSIMRVYNMITSLCGELVANHVRVKIMEKAKTIDMVSYDTPEFYARMENAAREAGTRPIMIVSSMFSVMSTVISLVSYIIVLFAVSIWAPFLIILVSLPSAVISFVFRKKNVNYMFHRSRARREMDYYATTVVDKDLAKEVRMFSLTDVFCNKYQETFRDYYRGLRSLRQAECFWSIGAAVLTSAAYCFLYILLARGVYDGRYEVGSFSLYTGAIMTIGGSVGTLISTTAMIYEGTLFIENLIAFLKSEPQIVPVLAEPAAVRHGQGHTIEFRNVSFRYPGNDHDVVHRTDLLIRPGETVVIVGLNGAGKTTLVKLLTRLYDPTEGMVLLDGRDIREYNVEELYAMFGIIFQDFGKYAVTARENIAFGDVEKAAGEMLLEEERPEEAPPERSMGSVREAAAQSGADTFIEKFPKGYDTPLMRYFDVNGAELSVGQWQKLAIARAFYGDSEILILDEPTASLDPLAEQEIFRQFNELRGDKTSIFISHRLSSATIADQILVMDNGEIVERGSHAELMEKKGQYWKLFTTQAERYQTPA